MASPNGSNLRLANQRAPSQVIPSQARLGIEENLPANTYYRDKAFIIAVIDLTLCLWEGLKIAFVAFILLFLFMFTDFTKEISKKEVPTFTIEEGRVVIATILFVISFYIANFVLRVMSAVSLYQATQEGVSPPIAKEKVKFWRCIKAINLIHGLISLAGGVTVLAHIFNGLSVVYSTISLIVGQLYIRELNQHY